MCDDKSDELPDWRPAHLAGGLMLLVTSLDANHEDLTRETRERTLSQIAALGAALAMAAGATAGEVASTWRFACDSMSRVLAHQMEGEAAQRWEDLARQLPTAEQVTDMVEFLRRNNHFVGSRLVFFYADSANEDGYSCSISKD